METSPASSITYFELLIHKIHNYMQATTLDTVFLPNHHSDHVLSHVHSTTHPSIYINVLIETWGFV
jgi:hypothetical protein